MDQVADLRTLSFNQTDTVVLIALAVFVLFGLLFGAKQIGARIICDFASCLFGLFFANMVLSKIEPLDFYRSIIASLWNNAILVNWIAYLLLALIIGGLLYLVLKLIFGGIVKGTKNSPVLSRVLGLVLGIADWAILLVSITFILTLIPTWFGSNTPSWVIDSNNYLSSSLIIVKLMGYFRILLSLLGLA